MSPRPLRALALASFPILCAGAAAAAGGDGVGERIGAVAVKDLAETQADSFDDFVGRTVLIEFWAEWCPPCLRSIPHLNELHEKYADQGLSILGLTSDQNDRQKTLAVAEKLDISYAWGWDPGGALLERFGVTGIPHSLLVDPDGIVIWRGHPAQLTEERIQEALAGALARPVWTWPAGSEAVRQALAEGDMARALTAAEQLSGGGEVAKALQQMVRGRLEAIAAAAERGDYLLLDRLVERAGAALRGLPEEGRLAVHREALAKPEAQRILAGQKEVVELSDRLQVVRTREEATDVLQRLRSVRDQHEGTIVARQAGEWIELIERKLAE